MNLEGSYLISKPKTDWVMRKSKMTKKRPKLAIFYFWELPKRLGIGFGTCQQCFAKGYKVSDPSLFIRLDMYEIQYEIQYHIQYAIQLIVDPLRVRSAFKSSPQFQTLLTSMASVVPGGTSS